MGFFPSYLDGDTDIYNQCDNNTWKYVQFEYYWALSYYFDIWFIKTIMCAVHDRNMDRTIGSRSIRIMDLSSSNKSSWCYSFFSHGLLFTFWSDDTDNNTIFTGDKSYDEWRCCHFLFNDNASLFHVHRSHGISQQMKQWMHLVMLIYKVQMEGLGIRMTMTSERIAYIFLPMDTTMKMKLFCQLDSKLQDS